MHTWKYKYSDTLENDLGLVFEIEDETNLTDMIGFFERYLKAVGYSFDGNLEICNEKEEPSAL